MLFKDGVEEVFRRADGNVDHLSVHPIAIHFFQRCTVGLIGRIFQVCGTFRIVQALGRIDDEVAAVSHPAAISRLHDAVRNAAVLGHIGLATISLVVQIAVAEVDVKAEVGLVIRIPGLIFCTIIGTFRLSEQNVVDVLVSQAHKGFLEGEGGRTHLNNRHIIC